LEANAPPMVPDLLQLVDFLDEAAGDYGTLRPLVPVSFIATGAMAPFGETPFPCSNNLLTNLTPVYSLNGT
uniref:PEROXIDASE_4 domain-containing protein n=1 Tax=Gongylonema pulchrum TaxID=637853 RepID=A0A183CVF3_9BILA